MKANDPQGDWPDESGGSIRRIELPHNIALVAGRRVRDATVPNSEAPLTLSLGRPVIMTRWHEQPSNALLSLETHRAGSLASRANASKPRRKSGRTAVRNLAAGSSTLLSVRISPDLEKWLRSQATKERRTVPQIVTHALAAYRVEGEMMERLMAERAARMSSRRTTGAGATVTAKRRKAKGRKAARPASRASRGRVARSS